jgi:cytochrome bd-type quinol oxidase subunit 2
MNKLLKQILILACLVALLILPYFVFAADTAPLKELEKLGPASGYKEASDTTFSEIIGTAIRAFLSLLGVIFIGLMIYGGYDWMIASGDEEKVTKAKNIIRRAIIGLLIVIASYAIWNFIRVSMDI